MTFPLRRRAALAAPLAALLPSAGRAQQDAFPARQVQIVVPFPPGGATDLMARLLTEPMQRALGQAVIVENRAGATGARSVLALPAVVQRMTELGADPGGGGPDELARFLRGDVEKWLRVVREAGVKPE